MPTTPSPLRYPGGKTKLYDYVRALIQANDLLGETYIEPFAGGAGLALKLLLNNDVRRIVINDLDYAIFSFWKSITEQTAEFCEKVYTVSLSVDEWEIQKNIYENPTQFTQLEYGFATFYLNRTNVSGVIKGGIIGGKEQKGIYGIGARFNKDSLVKRVNAIADRKDQIVVCNMDARELISPSVLRQFYKVFINFDPPYVKKGKQLYKNSFAEYDHADLCRQISECGRKWIVTYDICPLTASLYSQFRASLLDINYSIKTVKRAKEYIFFSHNLELPPEVVAELL